MNKAILVARLVTEPNVKVGQSGTKVCTFRVAIDDNYKDNKHTDFLNVVCFNKQAENCEKYLAKGRQVAVEGKIHTDSYENKDGKKVYTTEIYAERIEFIGGGGKTSAPKQDDGIPKGFEELDPDAGLPF